MIDQPQYETREQCTDIIVKGVKDGSLDFNLISLFPPTYKGRKNGLRVDIAEALEELHPVRMFSEPYKPRNFLSILLEH